jgi:uncharacterized membrane protein
MVREVVGVLAASAYVLTFRILHIVGAALWVGSVFIFTVAVGPAARAMGPEGGRLMQILEKERKLPQVMTFLAVTTLVSGGFLYWHDSAGFTLDWIGSRVGITFTVGAVLAVVVFAMGFLVLRPTTARMAAIGEEVRQGGGPPTEAQAAAIARAQRTMAMAGRATLILLALSTVAMAVARYVS